jgi:PKD repeat protein
MFELIYNLFGGKKMNNVKKIKKNKAVNYMVMVFVAILMISISFTPVLSDNIEPFGDTRFMKVIIGTSAKCSGGPPTTGSPVSITSSLGTVTGVTLSDGSFQVSIAGEPPDPGWPDGTAFTVTITDGSWTGTKDGTVSGTITDVGLVTLYPPTLNADADASPTTIVVGETVSFTGSATGGATPYSWSWDFGGDGSSTQQNPTHTFNTAGTYVCVLTVTDACLSTDTDSVTITVNPALSCDAGGPYSGTICIAVQFSGTATGGHPGYTWDWDFGDGSPHSSEQNPTHLYASDGSYTATLTVTDSQLDTAVDTASVSISTPAVVAEAGGPYSGTICDPISFTGGVTGGCAPYSFSWDFGDGGSSTLQNPTYQYSSDGSYTATFTVTDDKGASDTDTASVSISTPALVADADGPDNGCTDEPVTFTGSASGGCPPYSYSWGFGDGGTSTQQNPSYTYDTPGVYTVTLSVTDDASNSDSDTFTITIVDCLLDVDAHGPYYGEVGETIEFTGSVSGGTPPYYYQWDLGDGAISEDQNPTHVYSEPSPPAGYPITLYVIDSTGTTGQDQTRAYITGDLIADADGPYFGSVGESIQFTGSASGGTSPYSFSWDFGDGSSSTEQNPTHSYNAEGEYTVILTVTDDEDKTDSDSTTATIGEDIPLPDLECEGSLSWVDVIQGTTVNGTFIVRNVGDSGSVLNWEVDGYPEDWGEWTFTPSEGSGLNPGDGDLIVEVTLVAPKAKSMLLFSRLDDAEEFTGDITVINSDNSGDSEVIPVSITVSRGKVFSLRDIFEYLIYRFPILEKILEILV